jgi:hypothetical protein
MSNAVNMVVRQQIAMSRNLNEGWRLKMRRLFWCCVYLSWACVVAVRWLRREVLGERVKYRGRICCVYNWAASAHPWLRWENGFEQYCDRSEIQTLRRPSTYWFRMRSGFRFYATNWLSVDVQNKILQEGQQ